MAHDPLRLLDDAVGRANQAEPTNPNAVALGTVDANGRPTTRMVNVRRVEARGPVFLTNRQSPKARHIDAHPYAALCFYWRALGEQVRVDGPVEPLTDAEADAYWARRRRSHQLDDWASEQSRELTSLAELEAHYAERNKAFSEGTERRPPCARSHRVLSPRQGAATRAGSL